MKKIRVTLLALIISLNTILLSGCWNYREVDKLAIVAGVAIDKEKNGLYKITVEFINIIGEKDAKTSSEIISMEGETIFDAVRNGIALSGRRLYWSHTKVLILGRQIASEGVMKVLDWYNRDSETRRDVHILISEEDTAEEIFQNQGTTPEVKSFILEDMIKNQNSLSKAPHIDIMQFTNDLKAEGVSATAASISLKKSGSKVVPQIMGTAVFKSDKLVGFLSGEETKSLMFIKNKVKAGVLPEATNEKDAATKVSLEIFNNKTKVKPVVNGENVKINLNVDVTAAIDEIEGPENLIDEEGRLKLEQIAEKNLKKQIELLIKKVQSEYGVDIFGFGSKLREDKNGLWKDISGDWKEKFKYLEVEVSTKVNIRNSAILSKPLEEND